MERYQRVRRFLPTVFATVAFAGTQAGQPLLTAWRFLADLEPQRHPDRHDAPLALVPGAWRRLVLPHRQAVADRRA